MVEGTALASATQAAAQSVACSTLSSAAKTRQAASLRISPLAPNLNQSGATSDCIIDDSDELSGPGAQIPSAEIFRCHRTGTCHAHSAKCYCPGAHCPRLHFQRPSRHRQNHGCPHPGDGPELPLRRKRQALDRTLRRLRRSEEHTSE